MIADIRQKAIDEALTWERTPFHHMGRVKGVGVDCAHLLIEVYHAVGAIPALDVGYYPNDWFMHRSEERFLKWVMQFAHEVPIDRAQIADVFLFQHGRCASHGAIKLSVDQIIHAQYGIGVTRAGMQDAGIGNRIKSAWSLWDDDL